jgi:hypothetical protein
MNMLFTEQDPVKAGKQILSFFNTGSLSVRDAPTVVGGHGSNVFQEVPATTSTSTVYAPNITVSGVIAVDDPKAQAIITTIVDAAVKRANRQNQNAGVK